MATDQDRDRGSGEFLEKLVKLNRVAKVVKGGRRFSFSALTVVGDRAGRVGYGFGKANDVSDAIRKSIEKAKKSMVRVPLKKTTLPHQVIGRFKSAQVLLQARGARDRRHRRGARARRHGGRGGARRPVQVAGLFERDQHGQGGLPGTGVPDGSPHHRR